MGEPSLGIPPPEKSPEDRLDSWKEIAAYLGRDVTTVQRWEKREGMPVHRHLHDRMGSVHGSRAELDAWVRGRSRRGAQADENSAPPPNPPAPVANAVTSKSLTRWTFISLLALVATMVAVGATLWLQERDYFWRNPIADVRIQKVTDIGGVAQAADRRHRREGTR